MNIFEKRSYAWWQVGIIKIALLAIGIAIGAYWSTEFLPYVSWLISLGIVLGIYLVYLRFKK